MKRLAIAILAGAALAATRSPATGDCAGWPNVGNPFATSILDDIRDIANAQIHAEGCQGDCPSHWSAARGEQEVARSHGTGCCHGAFNDCASYHARVAGALRAVSHGKKTVVGVGAQAHVAGKGMFTRSAAGSTWAQDGFAVGMGIVVRGFGGNAQANNGAWKVEGFAPANPHQMIVTDPGDAIVGAPMSPNQSVFFVPLGMVTFDGVGSEPTGTNESVLTRSAGSFVAEGFVPGAYVEVGGFPGAHPNNGTWRIKSVQALQIVVEDPGDAIPSEAPAAGRWVRYDPPLACFDTLNHQDPPR